ncbi:MAG: SDR family NAD(P)-dependent oxidoreductase [Armatimonadota bacterium]
MRLRGKVAAITGAGRGIGRAAAELFAREGAGIALLEIDETSGREAEEAVTATGASARFLRTDIADARQVEFAFSEIERTFGRLDILYNNASIFVRTADGLITDVSPDAWHWIIGVNLHGIYHCCKYGIPAIARTGGGSVINTASSAGVIGIPACDAYTASKGATISLTRALAVAWGPRGVRVNCIAPAAISTDMVRESNLSDPEFDEASFLRSTPLGRWGTPEEIANVALFLASEESSYVNGAVIVADGGITVTGIANVRGPGRST